MRVRMFAAGLLLGATSLVAFAPSAGAAQLSDCSGPTPVSTSGTPGPVGAELLEGYEYASVCAGGVVGAEVVYAEADSTYTGPGSSSAVNLYTPGKTTVLGHSV